MLRIIKESELTNLNNTDTSLVSIEEEYYNTIEFKSIKKLINEEHLEYVTEYLRNLLKIKKANNPNCFNIKGRFISSVSNGKRVIIYVRLSVEDLEKTEGNVSKSILNQLLMLLKYCSDKELEVVGIFYEEDISGTDGTRTEWNKSLLFCELGNTDIYICKSQSRFARSIEFVEKYLHKNFIEWNIRFLSIVDNIDTERKGNKKASQITAMTDQWRVEDQSISTRETFKTKNEAGQWTGSFAPYGYIEDPKDQYHFVIDEPAAKIVREIYELYANGNGYYKITQELNNRKVPTPSKYKILQGSNYVCPVAPDGSEFWNTDTIRKILMDETYDGALIQHRTENIAYNIDKRRKIPKHEQRIVACCHEKIVDPAISKIVRQKFKDRKEKALLKEAKQEANNLISIVEEKLQTSNKIPSKNLEELNSSLSILKDVLLTSNLEDIIDKFNTLRELSAKIDSEMLMTIQDNVQILTTTQTRSRPNKDGEIHIFSRKVFCKCCGKTFQKNNCKSGPRKNPTKKAYLQCRNKKNTGGLACDNNNSIRYEVLEEYVLNELNKLIEKYFNRTELEASYYEKKIHSNFKNDIEALNKEKKDIERKIKLTEDKFSMLYDDKANGIITADEFMILKNRCFNDKEKYSLRVNEIDYEIIELQEKENQEENEKVFFEKYKHIEKLDRLIVETFISKIIIGRKDSVTNERDIKIIWNMCV